MVGPGGNSLKPETALSYSAGFDVDPSKFVHQLDGLFLTATYWQTKYAGAITSPVMTLDTQLAALNKNLIINPSQAQIDAAINSGRRITSLEAELLATQAQLAPPAVPQSTAIAARRLA